MQDFDFFGDAGIADGGILQAVAQGFVIQGDVAGGGDLGAGVSVPVVDEFVFHFVRWRLIDDPRCGARNRREILRCAQDDSVNRSPVLKLIANSVAARGLGVAGLVDRVAEFAAIDFCFFAD